MPIDRHRAKYSLSTDSHHPTHRPRMPDTPVIARFAPREWRTYRDLRLRALADSPDAFGSTLEAESGRAEADWARRLEEADARADLPLVAHIGGEGVGLAWGRLRDDEPKVAHLYQVWVAPEYRGRGVGQMLLDAAMAWARVSGARTLALDVTCGDSPATRLYVRAGFRPAGDPVPLRAGSSVSVQPMQLALDNEIATDTE